MPIQLTVQPPSGSSKAPLDTQFTTDTVTIGRSPDAQVCLADANRVVSKQHAEIRRSADGYHLVDLGSKNFTFLGETQLEAGRPYALNDGDAFRIGGFTLTVHLLPDPTSGSPEAAAAYEETVFDADFTNPFEEPVADLRRALDDIAAAYDDEAPTRRADALRDALRPDEDAAPPALDHPGVQRVLSMLGLALAPGDHAAADAPSVPDQSPNAPAAVPPTPNATDPAPAAASTADPSGPSGASTDETTMALVRAVRRLISIPWQFRNEFIGQTIIQPPESAFLYDTPDAVRDSLFDESISAEERARRVACLNEAVDAVAIHQVAMLDGYKASVTTGAGELLDALDPELLTASVCEESPIYQWIPILASPTTLKRLTEQHAELKSGAWSVAEHRIFRPAFIKSYLTRMTAAEQAPKAADTPGTSGAPDAPEASSTAASPPAA
jgi:predicted component of type VI protein secretion system